MKRRTFIRNAAGAGMLGLFPSGLSSITREILPDQLEKREMGLTGLKVSVLGFGGIVVRDATPEQASERVQMAIDRGINFFDVAPAYGDSEVKLGPALEPWRKDVVLACKTGRRDRDHARRELEQSLKRLRTDYFDLYQLHNVSSIEDVERVFDKGGAMETLLEAKEEGKARFLGFSSHSVDAAMMLMERFDFDTIMFPVSPSSWYAGNFGPQVLEYAHKKQLGILALKSMVRGPRPSGTPMTMPKAWYDPMTDPDEAVKALRFALSHPITLALPPGNEDLFQMALNNFHAFEPLDPDEAEQLKRQALDQTPLFQYSEA
jgi:aryl-alcohol dehydrogenase-like predicted oxidoreductase